MTTRPPLVRRELGDDSGTHPDGGVPPGPAGRRSGALLHARQSAAPADRDGADVEPTAVIDDLDSQAPMIEGAIDRDAVDTRVPGHVGEGLLDDAVPSRLHLAPQPSLEPGAPELDMDAGLLAVALREPDERRLQPQIVQDCGPEVEGEVVHATQQLDGELPSPGQPAGGSLGREAVVSFQC